MTASENCPPITIAVGYAQSCAMLSEENSKKASEQAKAEVSNDKAKVTEQTTKEKTETRKKETEDSGHGRDNSAQQLTAK